MRRGRWLEICWYVALSALVLAAHLVHGTEYFVAPGGHNSNPGTALLPWATLQYAADHVVAGDRVVARPGNYVGFYLDMGGTDVKPIEFFGEPGAVITQRNAVTPDGINLEVASYVSIDGFAVAGMPRAGVRTVGLPDRMATNVTIRNVMSSNNGYWGILTGHVNNLLIENNKTSGSIAEHGIYVSNSGDNPIIRNNQSWNNRANGIHMNGDINEEGDGVISGALVSGNRIWNNGLGGGSGINMDGVQNSLIENNLIWGNHASGISLYQIDGGAPSSGNVVINNTVHQAADGRWALNIQDGATGNTVLNNIFLSEHSYRGAMDVSADSLPGLVSDYNAVISRLTPDGGDTILSLAQWKAQTGHDAHSFATTPGALFVNWQAGDYRLKPGVAAINAGTSMLAPAVDLNGTPRPAGSVDIGAIEFAAPGAADFTGDGLVTAADLAAWRTAFDSTLTGDADRDADSDGADFLLWQRQLSASGAQGVPEPGVERVAWLLFFGLLWRSRQ
jgi:hypothetical protein